MTIMQVGIVACLAMKKAPGRSAVKLRKDLPETVLSQRGLFTDKGKMVIFRMCKHGENDSIRTDSAK